MHQEEIANITVNSLLHQGRVCDYKRRKSRLTILRRLQLVSLGWSALDVDDLLSSEFSPSKFFRIFRVKYNVVRHGVVTRKSVMAPAIKMSHAAKPEGSHARNAMRLLCSTEARCLTLMSAVLRAIALDA
jgi:hypothetical protein